MIKISVDNLRCLPGMSGTLSEKTALVTIGITAPGVDWQASLRKVARGFERQAFFPHPLLWDLKPDSWLDVVVPARPDRSIADWIVGLSILFQRFASASVLRGAVLSEDGDVYKLAIPYEREDIFQESLKFSLNYLLQWLTSAGEASESAIKEKLMVWSDKLQASGMHPTTQRFAVAAKYRSIPISTTLNILQLGQGASARKLNSSLTDATSNIGVSIAKDKFATSRFLAAAGFHVPASASVRNIEQAKKFAASIGWPVVVKPKSLDQGVGVVPDIRDEKTLQQAFDAALRLSPTGVIVEKHVQGEDYRLLIVDGEMTIATHRQPGRVIGDGVHKVIELIDQENRRSARTTNSRGMLIALSLDAEALDCLTRHQLTPDSVPAVGQPVILRRIANISVGGTATDVTAIVHPDNKRLVERAARVLGLDMAGVDFLCPDITQSWKKVGGSICEVNAQPGFRVHWLGDAERDLEGEIVEGLFKGKSSRIPTTAITGTNGKSTTAQMMHHIWLTYGKTSGVCTTQGVWIEREQIRKDNLSGFPGAKILLADPIVEAAVVELPRKGLIYFGHPCDTYDVGALLNIQNDHIGEDGVQSLEAMAQLKAEVLQRAEQAVVINADDPLCLAMREYATAKKHILVARSNSNPIVAAHIAKGGCAVFIAPHKDVPWIYIVDEHNDIPVMPLWSVPATMEGLVPYNELNALSATALAWAHRIPETVIADALGSFKNSHELNPGRFNFIEGYPFRVLLDYAHNPDGVKHVCEFIENIPAKRKLAVIFQIGNRSAAHIDAVAPVLAQTFEYFVIGQDKSLVEKCPDYQGENPSRSMFQHFINSLKAAGVREDAIMLAQSESEGVELGLANAKEGDFLSVLTEEGVSLPLLLERASPNA